ncbi:MAG: CPBP family intramembrane metalloprotease, partial [bacterium]|nr:CPBP family intramembrane metalloprotease [bacterium]
HSGDTAGLFAFHLASRFVFYTAWELLFRGLIQRAVAKKAGAPAGIVVQTALSTVAHFSFPLSETIASFFGGLVWGVQAERAKSIWPGVLQHWIIGAALETVIVWA